MSTLPLADLKVADFSWVVAGPVVGRALADFGATVVRIESGTRIETARMMQPFYQGRAGRENSALYGTCNAGKYGLTLNLKTEEGRAVARDLAAWADVVAESYAPGQMASWGLDYASIREVNPSVIMLSTALMGQTGPAARLAGYGNIGASVSGYQDLVGWPDQLPIGPFGPYTDYVGPRFSLVVLLAALDHRRRTGEGCHIDLAQSEVGVFLLSPQLADYFDRGTVAQRRGNRDEQFAPHGVYQCLAEQGRDRFVAIAVCDDAQWRALAGQLQRPDLAADPGLADAAGRLARADELDAALAAWTATQRAPDVEARLQAQGVPAHLAVTSADWARDPQLAHRGHLRRLPHERFGAAFVEGPRYLLSETPGQVTRSAPTLGRDNEQVLRGLLGYDQARYDQVAASGALALERGSYVSEDWEAGWQPLAEAVGRDFGDGTVVFGADAVEPGTIRRYLEPLEIGCPIHYDADAARAAGYPGIVAPYTATMVYSVPPMWRPGEPTLYESADRDAQPARSPINNEDLPLAPKTTGFFATDISMEFLRPLTVGERVGRRGQRLISCTPKQTSMGRGAFLTWESELVTERGEVVARVRTGTYAYNPAGPEEERP